MSFTAQFNTLCGACDEWIQAGDSINVSLTGSVHIDCDPVVDVKNLPRPCGTCWQVPAVSGVCGCDE